MKTVHSIKELMQEDARINVGAPYTKSSDLSRYIEVSEELQAKIDALPSTQEFMLSACTRGEKESIATRELYYDLYPTLSSLF